MIDLITVFLSQRIIMKNNPIVFFLGVTIISFMNGAGNSCVALETKREIKEKITQQFREIKDDLRVDPRRIFLLDVYFKKRKKELENIISCMWRREDCPRTVWIAQEVASYYSEFYSLLNELYLQKKENLPSCADENLKRIFVRQMEHEICEAVLEQLHIFKRCYF